MQKNESLKSNQSDKFINICRGANGSLCQTLFKKKVQTAVGCFQDSVAVSESECNETLALNQWDFSERTFWNSCPSPRQFFLGIT